MWEAFIIWDLRWIIHAIEIAIEIGIVSLRLRLKNDRFPKKQNTISMAIPISMTMDHPTISRFVGRLWYKISNLKSKMWVLTSTQIREKLLANRHNHLGIKILQKILNEPSGSPPILCNTFYVKALHRFTHDFSRIWILLCHRNMNEMCWEHVPWIFPKTAGIFTDMSRIFRENSGCITSVQVVASKVTK